MATYKKLKLKRKGRREINAGIPVSVGRHSPAPFSFSGVSVMGKWEKNETWQKDVWLMILTFSLALSMLVGFIGWIRYRDAVRAKNEQDVMIGNFYKTIE
jgi:hypothetical protein